MNGSYCILLKFDCLWRQTMVHQEGLVLIMQIKKAMNFNIMILFNVLAKILHYLFQNSHLKRIIIRLVFYWLFIIINVLLLCEATNTARRHQDLFNNAWRQSMFLIDLSRIEPTLSWIFSYAERKIPESRLELATCTRRFFIERKWNDVSLKSLWSN